jgi:hypothetical protein
MSTQQIAREAVRPQGESQEEYEARRKAEVDAILERSHVTRDSIENGGAVEFQDPNFIADRESFERNPELAKALLDDVMPWEEPGFVASLKGKDEVNVLPPSVPADEKSDPIDDFLNKIDQEPVPSAAQLADNVVEVVSQVVELNTAGAAQNVADKLVPELGTVMQHRGPSAVAYGFPPAVDALITKAKLTEEQTSHLLSQFSNLFKLSSQMRARVQRSRSMARKMFQRSLKQRNVTRSFVTKGSMPRSERKPSRNLTFGRAS